MIVIFHKTSTCASWNIRGLTEMHHNGIDHPNMELTCIAVKQVTFNLFPAFKSLNVSFVQIQWSIRMVKGDCMWAWFVLKVLHDNSACGLPGSEIC